MGPELFILLQSNVKLAHSISFVEYLFQDGSKEEPQKHLADFLYSNLQEEIKYLKDSIVVDDRTTLTIGRRHLDARRIGYRYIIVINEKSSENIPLFEFNDTKTDCNHLFNKDQIINYIKENTIFYDSEKE